jgi:Ni,Fe-hydrogenase I large subunit
MSDEELVKALRDFADDGYADLSVAAADRIEALTAKVKLMDDLDVINGEKIEALTAKLNEANEVIDKQGALLADAYGAYLDWDEVLKDRADHECKAKLVKAVELLKEARQDLEEYVTHEWPKDEHPVYDRKWDRDMELCRRIDATLAEIEGSNAP